MKERRKRRKKGHKLKRKNEKLFFKTSTSRVSKKQCHENKRREERMEGAKNIKNIKSEVCVMG